MIMRNTSEEHHKIIAEIKEFLKAHHEAGLEWTRLPERSLCPAILAALQESAQQCTRCRLSASRTRVVFGEGDPRARLLFIGEAPGAEEDRTGRPFIGRAGELLTKIIEAIGLSRDQVYISSVVKCRPPENRAPEQDEIAACKPFLIKQIQAIQPAVICTLGTVSTQVILNTRDPITKCRGKFYDVHGIQVMPTFHPAYLLRNPKDKKLVWEDMQRIQALYQTLGSNRADSREG